jgi:hypothetical protein
MGNVVSIVKNVVVVFYVFMINLNTTVAIVNSSINSVNMVPDAELVKTVKALVYALI